MNNKIRIYEPGMCCSTGLCGPSIDSEIMRITTVINSLEKNNIDIKRFNLTNNPDEFVNNKIINDLLVKDGEENFPVTLVDDKIVKKGNYPTNEELTNWTGFIFGKNKSEEESGCCSNSNVCDISCSPRNNNLNSGCGGGGCC